MNKYFVELGELALERISEAYVVYTKDSKEELKDNQKFLEICDKEIANMYYDYAEEDEDIAPFLEDMGIIRIENWKEKYDSYNLPTLYDER